MNIDEKVETKINIKPSETKIKISTEAETKFDDFSDTTSIFHGFSDSDVDVAFNDGAFSDSLFLPSPSSDSDCTGQTWSKDLRKGSKTKRKPNKCTSKLKKRVKCEHCDMRFTLHYHLKLHQRVHTGEKLFKCSECNKSYYRKNHLVTHSLIHKTNQQSRFIIQPMNTNPDAGRKFKCEFCYKKFYTTYALKRHKATHDGENPYKCSRCYIKLSNKEDLELHFLSHEPNHQEVEPIEVRKEVLRKKFFDLNRRYKCEYCKKRFKRPQHLEGHLRIHTGEKPYKCLWCDKTFSHNYSLDMHSEIHEKNRAPVDLKKIIRESINQIFNEIAHNADCHVCDWEGCERRFLTYFDFVLHSSIHMKEYRFQCSFGSNNIKHLIPLMYHIEAPHPINNRAYQYEVLTTIRKNMIIVAEDGSLGLSHNSDSNNNDDTVSVEKKNNVDQILRNTDDINWNCYCFVRRLSSTEMEKGFVEKEILDCHQCKASFKTELEGIVHYLCVHKKNMPNQVLEKKFKCEVCDKTYLRKRQLTQHRRTHTETHRFICLLCNTTFSRRDHFQRHSKIHERSNLPERKSVAMNQTLLDCHECKKTSFKTELEGIVHYLCVHKKNMPMPVVKKQFKCDVCDKTYSRKTVLTLHTKTHAVTHPFLCSLCNKVFSSSFSLNRHSKIHERSNLQVRKSVAMNQSSIQKEPKSKRTKETYNLSDESRDNSLSATSCLGLKKEPQTKRPRLKMDYCESEEAGYENEYSCNECGIAFLSRKLLKSHERLSHRLLPHKRGRPRLKPKKIGTLLTKGYICKHCNKQFKGSKALQIHIKTHLVNKQYNNCSKYQKQLAGLMTDLEQPKKKEDENHNAFVCHWQGCNNRFFDYYDLITHSEIHLNNQSFQCCLCPEIFQQVSHLKIHCETSHSLKTSDIGSGRSTVEIKETNFEMIDSEPTIKFEKEEPNVIVMQSATAPHNICTNTAVCKEELILLN